MIPGETREFALAHLAIATNTPSRGFWLAEESWWVDLLMADLQYSGPQPEPTLSEMLAAPLGTEFPG